MAVATTPTVEQLQERIEELERKMESMAEIVAASIYWTFGDGFPGNDSWAGLEWEQVLLTADQNEGIEETIGWWDYTVDETAKRKYEQEEAQNA